MTINHICIGTKNISDSMQFYMKYFNFKNNFASFYAFGPDAHKVEVSCNNE